MDLREELSKKQGKAWVENIVAWIGTDAKRFKELMLYFLEGDYVTVQRASWPIGIIGERQPQLILPYLPVMIKRMHDKDVHVAVKRNVVRALQYADIPEAVHADVMNICFDFLADPRETVAVRCFSMTVIDNLSKIYPDIKQELNSIIEEQLQHETTAGFKSRAMKILRRKS